MVLAAVFQAQVGVCAHLAEDCDGRWLAKRLRVMASDLLAKADDLEEPQTERATCQRAEPILEPNQFCAFVAKHRSIRLGARSIRS